MTPLQRAQEHSREFAPTHRRLVDSFRKVGLSQAEAVEWADNVDARLLADKESKLEADQ